MNHKVYQGHRTPTGVFVTVTSNSGTRLLTPDWSQKIWNQMQSKPRFLKVLFEA